MKRIGFVGVLVAGMNALSCQATAEGDAEKGEKLFNGFLDCSACHSLEFGGKKVGPTLAGVSAARQVPSRNTKGIPRP